MRALWILAVVCVVSAIVCTVLYAQPEPRGPGDVPRLRAEGEPPVPPRPPRERPMLFRPGPTTLPFAMVVTDYAVYVLYDHFVYMLSKQDLSLVAKVDLRKLFTEEERAQMKARERLRPREGRPEGAPPLREKRRLEKREGQPKPAEEEK